MVKLFCFVLLCFLIPCFGIPQIELNHIPARRTSFGLRYPAREDIQDFGAAFYYGITPGLTGRIYGGVRLVDEGGEPKAFMGSLPPSPGFGVGLSYRAFPNLGNIGYWASGYAGLRYVKVNERHDTYRGEGRSAGLGTGLILSIPTSSYTLFPLAGLAYVDSSISGDLAFLDMPNESYRDLFGVFGFEVAFDKSAVLSLASVPFGDGEWDFSVYTYFRP